MVVFLYSGYEICLIFSIFTFLILNYVNRCPYKTLCYKVNRSIASTFNNNYIHARPGIDRVLKTKAKLFISFYNCLKKLM